MRKQFTIFLILIFVLGLVPINFSQAITQNQIDAEVQIVCTDGNDSWFSGSGTIIDPKGIILTNRHVVEGAYKNTCIIGFVESISQEPNFGTEGNYNLAEVKYQTSSNDMDAAILYLDNPTNKIYPYIDIWNSNSDNLKFGDKVEVIGFPSIGGSTITYASGDFSGFGSASDGTENYIKTIVSINHGNSGGAAYNSTGSFIGMPTFVLTDINSISYILSVNSIKNWLSNILGSSYQQQIIEEEPVIENTTPTIQEDITPPDISNVIIENKIGLNCNLKSGIITSNIGERIDYEEDNCEEIVGLGADVENDSDNFTLNMFLNNVNAKGMYIYFGNNNYVIPSKSEEAKYVDINNLNYIISQHDYKEGSNTANLEKYNYQKTNLRIHSLSYTSSKLIETGAYYLIIQLVDENNNFSDRKIVRYVYRPKTNNKNLDPRIMQVYSDEKKSELLYEIDTSKYYDLYIPNNQIYLEWNKNNEATNYEIKLKEKLPSGEFNEWTKSADHNCVTYSSTLICENTNLFNSTSGIFTSFDYLSENKKYYFFLTSSTDEESSTINPFTITYDSSVIIEPIIKLEEFDLNLANRLNGNILLQVESKGEAYYVYPDDSKKYYLGRPADAFNVMRELGLGATHEFITSHTTFPENVLGKILLDVEQNGEAYYIYPKDKKAYYLGRPADAFRIMRELGLGITNSDLNKIPEGSL